MSLKEKSVNNLFKLFRKLFKTLAEAILKTKHVDKVCLFVCLETNYWKIM